MLTPEAKAILSRLEIREVIEQTKATLEAHAHLEREKRGLETKIAELADSIEVQEATLFLDGVEGKNEAMRKALMTKKASDDALYQQLKSQRRALAEQRSKLTDEIAHQERLFAFLRARMRQNAAILNFLAEESS